MTTTISIVMISFPVSDASHQRNITSTTTAKHHHNNFLPWSSTASEHTTKHGGLSRLTNQGSRPTSCKRHLLKIENYYYFWHKV